MFRLATTDQDKDAITALHALCFKTGLSELQVALDDKRCFVFLGEGDVGYIVCRIQDKESELMWVGVRPEHRGEGWGRILTSAALDESRIRGTETMVLYVAEDNTPAIHLYKSLGFINVDTHVGFYANIQGGADDAIIMRTSLIKKEIQESDKNEPYLATTDQDKDAITALHSICFGPEEMSKLEVALDDENCFALLDGCDEDGQPTGYLTVDIQGKEAHGLWLGVKPNSRGDGLGRKLMSAGLNESRSRGAETYYAEIAEDNPTSAMTLRMHKNLGFIVVDSNLDYSTNDGERTTFTNHHVKMSLMPIK